MSMSPNITAIPNLKTPCAAHFLNAIQRQAIAIEAVRKNTPISHIANLYDVSRKFIYEQREIALNGIIEAFEKKSTLADDEILFHIPVTKKWIKQTVFGLTFICKSSYQGTIEFCRDLLDYHLCKGTIHNILYEKQETIKTINSQQDLSKVKVGLHDEIYPANDCVLVGCCARSTYCYLLDLAPTCDANVWGVNLLDLRVKQGLRPDFTVIDGGASARKGQEDAWSDIPAHGDVFHAIKPFLELLSYIDNRALEALKILEDLQHKIKNPRGKWKEDENRQSLLENLIEAESSSMKAFSLSNDLDILYDWLRNDTLLGGSIL